MKEGYEGHELPYFPPENRLLILFQCLVTIPYPIDYLIIINGRSWIIDKQQMFIISRNMQLDKYRYKYIPGYHQ